MRHFDIDLVFLNFLSDFFGNGFPNSLIVRSRSAFCLVNASFFELHARTRPAMFSFVVSIDDSCDLASWNCLFQFQ